MNEDYIVKKLAELRIKGLDAREIKSDILDEFSREGELNDNVIDIVDDVFDGTLSLSNAIKKLRKADTVYYGRIDWLGSTGAVRESIEYCDEKDFVETIKEENYYGVPMIVVLYTDENGKPFLTSHKSLEESFDPLPQGYKFERRNKK